MEAETKKWFDDAREAGWITMFSIDEITEAAMHVHGELAGLWRCQCCDAPVLDPAVCSQAGCSDASEAVMLYGDIILCQDCHEAAKDARAKIVVVEDEDCGTVEDVSALTDEEPAMASYLDRAESARNRLDRETIRHYPRDERRQLHRYQDSIEADRAKH
jgi:hypothetical protein